MLTKLKEKKPKYYLNPEKYTEESFCEKYDIPVAALRSKLANLQYSDTNDGQNKKNCSKLTKKVCKKYAT